MQSAMADRKVAFITGASRGIGRGCAMLATAKNPLYFSGRDIYGPTFYTEHELVDFD